MAFDYIDMLVDTKDEYLTGYFYKVRPITPDDGRITFKYKQLDPNSKVFGTVLSNVRADRATYAIKTNDHCGFNIGGYIVTQNGLIWEITEVITNEQVTGSDDVLRWFKTAKNAECSVRMIQINDLFNPKEIYDKYCEITINTNFRIDDRVNIDVKGYTGVISFNISASKGSITFEVPKGYALTVSLNEYGTGEAMARISIGSNKTVNDTLTIDYKS